MQYRRLGDSDLEVSEISLGSWLTFGVGVEAQAARACLDAAFDVGINFIDTANVYGRGAAETFLGEALKGRPRDSFVLATKLFFPMSATDQGLSRGQVEKQLDASLARLKTDVIDIMQIHFGPDPQKVLDDGECVRAMKDAREAGEIKYLGSSTSGDVLKRCIDSGDFQVVQVGYSLLHQDDGELISRARDKGIGVLVRSGFAGGWLTSRLTSAPREKRPPRAQALLHLCNGDTDKLYSLALHFLARHNGISSILVGTKSVKNLKQAMKRIVDQRDDALLDRAIKTS